MKVKLLVDVAEGGRDLAKAQAAADAFGLGKTDPKYPRLKVINNGKPRELAFKKGAVVEMPPDGAKKWIDRGIAEAVK